MDGIDPGAYLASLIGQKAPSSSAAPANLDQQILAALNQQPAAAPNGGAINPDSPQAYASAAATAAAQSETNPTLKLGFSPARPLTRTFRFLDGSSAALAIENARGEGAGRD